MLCYGEVMTEPAALLEEFEQLAASPVGPAPIVALPGESARSMAARIVEQERKRSLERRRRYKEITETLANWTNASPGVKVIRLRMLDLLSALTRQMAVKAEGDAAQLEAIKSRIPLPAPLDAIRVIGRGLADVTAKEHDAYVDLYYRLQASVLDDEDDTQPSGQVIESADALDALFAEIRGA